MADQFLGEIRMFAGNFAPTGWALCNGQIVPIQQNTALFSILGTTYGGDGRTTFALPNLMRRSPLQPGQGPGLSNRVLGESGGAETVVLTEANVAAHYHPAVATTAAATTGDPRGALLAQPAADNPIYVGAAGPALTMGAATMPGGTSLPHNNRQPYLCLTFIIALTGIFPPRG